MEGGPGSQGETSPKDGTDDKDSSRKYSFSLLVPPHSNNTGDMSPSPSLGGRSGSLIPSQLLAFAKGADDKKTSKSIKSHSIHGMGEEDRYNRPHQQMGQLSFEEKKFLLAVERGDVATVRRMVVRSTENGTININCVDPLGRSALLMAIDNENLEMVELLIEFKVETKDALLHAINEEYVEAVEVLLENEETIHTQGELHSWEAVPAETATFTPDITPLILAAHRDNYEIIKILLDRGGTLPMPHDLRCGCDECVTSRMEDSLRHSRSRINSYRALASPSLIALSSKDPILTAFELSWELRRLSFMEHEFRSEYQELRKQCQDFATALLDHTRSSYELEVLLNHDPTSPPFEHGERMQLNRLKLAIKLKQKKFVAHSNVQQLLASIWYDGLPGFRRKNMVLQALQIIKIGLLFPLFSFVYIIAPHTRMGKTMRKPFIKFICHSASYFTFLCLLILASQRIEAVVADWLEAHSVWRKWVSTNVTTRRGAPPSLVEWLILAWVFGLIWSEIKQLWDVGLREYINDMWNVLDFITNALYVATIALRIVAYQQVQHNPETKMLRRKDWDTWDPMLIAEGLFAAANIFSSLKLVYIFSVNPYLGPLQVSLSRMVVDIIKFVFLYLLTLFAFSCGMNQLLWFYADLEKKACDEKSEMYALRDGDSDPEPVPCNIWRRFSNLFETTQTLFWAAFGLVDLQNFELEGIKPFTRFWGMLMFGTYSVINVIVLLNLLIAMMNHSYQLVSSVTDQPSCRIMIQGPKLTPLVALVALHLFSIALNESISHQQNRIGFKERADIEWKFARSKLWISYFEEGGTAPPPFNIILAPKSIYYLCRWFHRKFCGRTKKAKKEHMRTIRRKAKQASEREIRYQGIMRNLVRRYVTLEQRKAENQGVTEDDVNEIKQDISAFRCELVEILKNSGMNTSTASSTGQGILPRGSAGGKKNRQKERRLMKGFNIGTINPSFNRTFTTVIPNANEVPVYHEVTEVSKRSPVNKLGRLVRLAEQRLGRPTNKRRWGTLVDAAKTTTNVRKLLTWSHSDDSSSSDNQESEEKVLEKVEEGTQTTPAISRKSFDKKSLIRSISTDSGTLPLDPSNLVREHARDLSKYRKKRHQKNSVSFDWTISEHDEPIEMSDRRNSRSESCNELESLNLRKDNEHNTDSESTALLSYSQASGPDRPLTTGEIINSPDSDRLDMLPIDGSPVISRGDCDHMTKESTSGSSSPHNGSMQCHLPGIQPIRHTSGGWL